MEKKKILGKLGFQACCVFACLGATLAAGFDWAGVGFAGAEAVAGACLGDFFVECICAVPLTYFAVHFNLAGLRFSLPFFSHLREQM